jgi:uncharacterized protein with HEPN domain
MQRRTRKLLFDAQGAIALVLRFVHGKDFADYLDDELRRSGVERQLYIMGEALAQLWRRTKTQQPESVRSEA